MTSPRQNPTADGIITLDLSHNDRPPAGYAGYAGPRRPSGWRRTVRAPLWLLVFVIVVGFGAVAWGTHVWDATQVRRFQSGSVSVLLAVPRASSFRGSGDGSSAVLEGDIQIVNTGPLDIAVGVIGSSSPGVAVTGNARGLVVPTGNARTVALDLRVDCVQQAQTEPLLLTLEVTTVDGVRRGYVAALNLDGTLRPACTGS